jgi:hypothetical protein
MTDKPIPVLEPTAREVVFRLQARDEAQRMARVAAGGFGTSSQDRAAETALVHFQKEKQGMLARGCPRETCEANPGAEESKMKAATPEQRTARG